MKKIMIMPALFDHVDLIREAKTNNYEVITCDNNPDNLGHQYSDLSVNISLLDVEGLIKFAKDKNIDAVAAFSTDIGAKPAALIAEKLNLVGNSVNAVNLMTNKFLFRDFLKRMGFCVPKFQILTSLNDLDECLVSYPSVLKPVDRAGSKGVVLINHRDDIYKRFHYAQSLSFNGSVILEDYIASEYCHIHGDALVQDGKVIFSCLGDQFFGVGRNRYAPFATTFPSSAPFEVLERIRSEIQHFISLVGFMHGGVNIEVRVDSGGNVFFIEIAPRFGGNLIAKAISLSCNVNLVECAFKIFTGQRVSVESVESNSNIFQFSLRSSKEGVFRAVSLIDRDSFEVLDCRQLVTEGELLKRSDGPDKIVAVYVLKAVTSEIVSRIIMDSQKYFDVIVD